MAKRDYERLPIETFGRHLIRSQDLDPVYVALPKAMSSTKQMHKWLIAYWCFYHCGMACYMSELAGFGFWNEMLKAAVNDRPSPLGEDTRWPRGHERRHARGAQGIRMITRLRERYGQQPQKMVSQLVAMCQGGIMFPELALHVRTHRLFGPWIAFKVGDMLERVCDCPVNFKDADVFMFKDPRNAALMLWQERVGIVSGGKMKCRPKNEDTAVRDVVLYLQDTFKEFKAPPNGDRGIELQEIETILCKWKSHMNGHYPLYNDIDEITEGLEGWGETAERFIEHMPRSCDAEQI